jgi:D-alanine-D-alanine ligase-like ATP-grasp enzyme
MDKLHVAVLMGGWSAEREVSLMSGNGVADALESRGHRVTRIDMDRNVAAAARRGSAPTSSSTRCTARRVRTAPCRG